ncbi:MAG: acyltransferase [Eubacterium sp.]|nr:acyltransferase [Eubacterium sp.]MCM1216082.1 acyltransferase [Lachnospiraceae bacterium]MCM1239809.1 acyltransferase [Lachnospiraceae bacterium]MCM1410183.1 acyltransferase [Lachnospiraceae bacterium]
MKSRNNIVELMRFLFSILVVGYHVQMSMNYSEINFFENGAVAVEFFFLISGYFMARSIERLTPDENVKIGKSTLRFMAKKVKGILPIHITANIVMLFLILIFETSAFSSKLIKGMPGLFFLQIAPLWNESFNEALIVPEWYLSAMLLSMVIIFPVVLFLRRRFKAVPASFGALGVIGGFFLIVGVILKGHIQQNYIYAVRAAAELILGMLTYYLSVVVSKHEYRKAGLKGLKIAELTGYFLPVILGLLPVSVSLQPLCMIVTVVGTFIAITVTFSAKGMQITNDKVNSVFGYLGTISLPIYLIHPVMLTLTDYIAPGMPLGVKMMTVFLATILLSIAYQFAVKNRKVKG